MGIGGRLFLREASAPRSRSGESRAHHPSGHGGYDAELRQGCGESHPANGLDVYEYLKLPT